MSLVQITDISSVGYLSTDILRIDNILCVFDTYGTPGCRVYEISGNAFLPRTFPNPITGYQNLFGRARYYSNHIYLVATGGAGSGTGRIYKYKLYDTSGNLDGALVASRSFTTPLANAMSDNILYACTFYSGDIGIDKLFNTSVIQTLDGNTLTETSTLTTLISIPNSSVFSMAVESDKLYVSMRTKTSASANVPSKVSIYNKNTGALIKDEFIKYPNINELPYSMEFYGDYLYTTNPGFNDVRLHNKNTGNYIKSLVSTNTLGLRGIAFGSITPPNTKYIYLSSSQTNGGVYKLEYNDYSPIIPKPWGVYIAGHPRNTVNNSLLNVSGTLFDITGQGRHAVIGGGFDAIFASESGNGASVSVPYIQGFKNTLSSKGENGSGTQIIWPSGSFPANNYTLSSITRYTNSANAKRILNAASGSNMVHGHIAGYPGHIFYNETYKTTTPPGPTSSNVTNVLDWCVTCATTNTTVNTPNNILINNVAKGLSNGPNKSSSGQLAINRSTQHNEHSDFAFQQLVIWDNSGVLDADQLSRISTLQNNYLQTGTIQYPFAIISTPPVITSVTNSLVTTDRKTNFSINFTIAVGALDASFTYLYSLDGGQTFADSLQVASPITINNLNEDQSYQFVIKHRSTMGDSEPSNMMTAIAKYPCFLEGSRILCMNVDTYDEEYVAIETLREGDLIKTSCSGYKAIKHIGYKTIPNPTDDPNKRNRLYRFPKTISRQMITDLYITGEHCVLYKDLSDALKERVYEHMGDIYITEENYRVPACLDERALPYKGEGPVTIWHFALENPDVTHNYGVYANGLLVESCSIEYLSELSKMKML